MDVSQKLLLAQGDINNNTQLINYPQSTNTTSGKLHTSSTTSSITKPADIDLNLIRKSNTTNTLNNSQTNPAKTTSNDVTFTNNDNLNENSDIDSDNDAISPLKSNVNRNLSHENVRKTRGKNIFKTLFCCFSSSHRSNLKNPKNGLTNQTNTSNQSAQGFTNSTNNANNNNNSNSLQNSNFYTVDNKENFTDINNSEYITTNTTPNNLTNNSINKNPNDLNSNNSYIPHIEETFSEPEEKNLLPPVHPSDAHKKCLIIDLDETLVHSSFKQVYNADFIVPVEIDGTVHQVYVLKRPYVDEFLKKMGELYECVLFTASLAKYADPVADLLDKWGVFKSRLFREACVFYRGNYVKDLSRLGRDLNSVIILDNSPASYMFHPENAVACTSWFDDLHDTELYDMIPFFERLANVDSVYSILKQSNQNQQQQQQHQQQIMNQTSYVQSQQIDNHQQVPSGIQSIIYQQQVENRQTGQQNYMLNENKILLSIDLMMANKQQQLQKHQVNNSKN